MSRPSEHADRSHPAAGDSAGLLLRDLDPQPARGRSDRSFLRRVTSRLTTDPRLGRQRSSGRGGIPLAVWVVLLPVFAVIQVSLVAFLPVPGAVPDLALVAVLGLAHHRGAVPGGLLGAWAGLWLDLLPPAVGPFGGWMLVLGLAGAVHGHVIATRRPGPLLALLLLAVSAAAATVGHALVMWFAGVPVATDAAARAAVGAAAWGLLLAPVALVLTGGRISAHVPGEELERQPTLLDAVTPGWNGTPAATESAPRPGHAGPPHQWGEPAQRAGGRGS